MNFFRFVNGSFKIITKGSTAYYAWVTFLILLIAWGGFGYANQLAHGLIVTHMRDSVSWGFISEISHFWSELQLLP